MTDWQYLQAQHQLARLWSHAKHVYAHLSPIEQWTLHDYFQPSKDLSDAELLTHRQTVSHERPALPQQAGLALSKLYSAAATLAVLDIRRRARVAPGGTSRGTATLHVSSVVQPELDPNALLQTLMAIDQEVQQGKGPDPSCIEDRVAGQRLILDEHSKVIRVEPLDPNDQLDDPPHAAA